MEFPTELPTRRGIHPEQTISLMFFKHLYKVWIGMAFHQLFHCSLAGLLAVKHNM